MIIAVDTSTGMTSVAVVDGEEVVVEQCHLDARRHAEVLAPMLDEVLQAVDRSSIDAVACGVGPGPYTGLRVGIATARALGCAWSVPVHGLCSLDAIAAAGVAAGVPGEFGVASDARRREVYWAWYSVDGTRLDGPRVNRPTDIDPELRVADWLGDGALAYVEHFARVPSADRPGLVHPQASWVGRAVQRLVAAGATPAATDIELSRHGADGAQTSTALRGHALLPPGPLYLRRADTTEPTSS